MVLSLCRFPYGYLSFVLSRLNVFFRSFLLFFSTCSLFYFRSISHLVFLDGIYFVRSFTFFFFWFVLDRLFFFIVFVTFNLIYSLFLARSSFFIVCRSWFPFSFYSLVPSYSVFLIVAFLFVFILIVNFSLILSRWNFFCIHFQSFFLLFRSCAFIVLYFFLYLFLISSF